MQNAIWAIYFHMILGPSNKTLNEQHQYCQTNYQTPGVSTT